MIAIIIIYAPKAVKTKIKRKILASHGVLVERFEGITPLNFSGISSVSSFVDLSISKIHT